MIQDTSLIRTTHQSGQVCYDSGHLTDQDKYVMIQDASLIRTTHQSGQVCHDSGHLTGEIVPKNKFITQLMCFDTKL